MEENNAIIPLEIVFAGKAILVLNEKIKHYNADPGDRENSQNLDRENQKTELIFKTIKVRL